MRIRFLAILALLIAACTGTTSEPRQYELGEFYIEGPTDFVAGSRSLAAFNSGQFPHTIIVTDGDGAVVAATDLIQPGETTALDVDLTEGKYQITCRIVAQKDDGRIVDHFQEGMSLTVEVSG